MRVSALKGPTMNPTTARAVLDVIDQFLADEKIPATEQSRLWDILCALRGPDEESAHSIKHRTTAVIRAQAFPLAAEKGIPNADVNTEESLVTARATAAQLPGSHFIRHITFAVDALELMKVPV